VDDGLRDGARLLGEDPLALALGGGEDYVLLCTSPAALAGFGRIGTVRDTPGIARIAADGTRRPVAPSGHVHRF
jgi:thiamine monophosphate kinase